MTWSRIFLLWAVAIAIGVLSGATLGALSSIVYQANLPVGDVFPPLVLMTSLVTAAAGAWSGFVAGLGAVSAIAILDRRLSLPTRRRNFIIGLTAGAGGYVALLVVYSGRSNLESPWTFAGLSAAIATTAFVAANLCGQRSTRRDSE